MNGRSILFNRLLIGFLAYFLCGLAHSALYRYDFTGQTTSDPASFSLGLLSGFNQKSIEANDCPGIPVGLNCTVTAFGFDSVGTNGMTTPRYGFTRIKEPLCDEKKDKSAGTQYVPLPFADYSGDKPIVTNDAGLRNFVKNGSPSCDGSCSMVSDGPYIKNSKGDNLFGFDNSSLAYGLLPMKYTGAECSSSNNNSVSGSTPPKSTQPKPPKGPADCPPRTTYGEVNGVKMCVKNAPLPTDPAPSPKPDDKDACVGNCDKWDPSKDPSTGDPGGTGGTGTGGTGTGGTGTGGTGSTIGKGPHGGDASRPASANASGPGDSSLSASCTDFKCKNKDPATCEIAKLAWNNKCIEEKAFKELTESELYKGGNKSMSAEGIEDMKLKLNFNGEGNLDMTDTIKKDRFLSGGGLADVYFSVYGKSYTLPFSKINKYLEMCGDIVVAFSLIAAARILSSAV